MFKILFEKNCNTHNVAILHMYASYMHARVYRSAHCFKMLSFLCIINSDKQHLTCPAPNRPVNNDTIQHTVACSIVCSEKLAPNPLHDCEISLI